MQRLIEACIPRRCTSRRLSPRVTVVVTASRRIVRPPLASLPQRDGTLPRTFCHLRASLNVRLDRTEAAPPRIPTTWTALAAERNACIWAFSARARDSAVSRERAQMQVELDEAGPQDRTRTAHLCSEGPKFAVPRGIELGSCRWHLDVFSGEYILKPDAPVLPGQCSSGSAALDLKCEHVAPTEGEIFDAASCASTDEDRRIVTAGASRCGCESWDNAE